MKYKIEKGDTYECIKTFIMEDGEKAYTKGREYFSEVASCITDNSVDVNHQMSDFDEFFEYFKFCVKK